jgi:regulator of sigma E protease
MGARDRKNQPEEMEMNPEAMLGFLINVLRFIILLGVLIFVHELGHFFAAKLSNVYVLRFSLGFGKRLFGFKRGETDYCISAIPFGGYVRMVGQEDMPRTQEEAEQAEPEIRNVPPEKRFDTQPTSKKILIGLAGPAMNLLFGIPVLWAAFVIGVNVPAATEQTYVGGVTPGSPAEQAGIQPGWRVLSINGQRVYDFDDIQLVTISNEDTPLDFKLEDLSGNVTEVTIIPQRTEASKRATVGIEPFLTVAVGEILPGMPAAESGLRENDIVIAYDGNGPTNENFTTWDKLIGTVNQSAGRPMTFTVLRDNEIHQITVTPKEKTYIQGLDLQDGTIVAVDEKRLGEQASKLHEGDVVVALNGQPLQNQDVEGQLLSLFSPGAPVELTVVQKRGFFEEPHEEIVRLPLGKRGMIGVVFSGFVVKQFDAGAALANSFKAYGDFLSLTMKTIYYLLTFRVSPREMAGPIGIAFLTTESLKLGVGYYLNLVALITINLGIINLLPIPVLDGGLILISVIDSIRRKPLEEKYLVLLQRIGFAFILFLVLVATYNDILRVINYFLGRGFIE